MRRGLESGQQAIGFVIVEIRMVALLDAMVAKQHMDVGRHTLLGEDGPAGSGKPHQRPDPPTDAGDTGHFGDAGTVELQCEVIGHLGRAGTARAGVNEGKIRVTAGHGETSMFGSEVINIIP